MLFLEMGKKALKPEERKEERINNNKKYNIDESTVFKVWSS